MRIPDQLLKCIGYVSRDEEKLVFGGTAFIVMVPTDDKFGFLHLVTAKHVAVLLSDGEAVVAFNGKDGLPLFMKNRQDVSWYFHPTDVTVDVAVLPMATARLAEYDYQAIPVSSFATQNRIKDYGIGVGDDVHAVGLYVPYPGRRRLAPIVKSGTIAMMSEILPHPNFGSMETIMIESRSLGGLSGSPVFARNTLQFPAKSEDGQVVHYSVLGDFHLLGLISGHVRASLDPSDPLSLPVNVGMSLVVPAEKIVEVLFSEEMIALRKSAESRES